MTTKMFCDGCDREITDHRGTKVTIAYEARPGAALVAPVSSDLCEGCLNTFRQTHLPRKWERLRPPIPGE